MSLLPETLMQILLFEGVAFLLLAAVFVSRRFFRQPIDRIRLTQAGFGLIAVAVVCVSCGIGPTWTIALPIVHESRERNQVERPDQPASNPGTALRSIPGFHEINESRERNEVERPDQPASNPVTALRSIPGFHWFAALFLPPLFLFLRDCSAKRKLRRLLKHSTDASEHVTEMFQQVSGSACTAVRLRLSHEITAPMVFGLFRPTLLLPAGLSMPELRACLVHEWSHIKNGDLLTWNLVRLFQYPLWMQPFYWMLRSRLFADQDFLADDDGVRACSETADYAQILLNFAKTRSVAEPLVALGMAGRQSLLRRRIDMLFTETRPVRKSNKRKLLLPLVLLAVLTLLGGGVRFSEATEPVTDEVTEPVMGEETEPVTSVRESLANASGSEGPDDSRDREAEKTIADAVKKLYPDAVFKVAYRNTKVTLNFEHQTMPDMAGNVITMLQDIPDVKVTSVVWGHVSDEVKGSTRIIYHFPILKIQNVMQTTENPFDPTTYPQGFAEQIAQVEKEVKENDGLALVARIVDAEGNPVKKVDYCVGAQFGEGFSGKVYDIIPQNGWLRTTNLLDSKHGSGYGITREIRQQIDSGTFLGEEESELGKMFVFVIYTATHRPVMIKLPGMFGKVYFADIKLEQTPEDELVTISGQVWMDDYDRPAVGETAYLCGPGSNFVAVPGGVFMLPGEGGSFRKTITDEEGRFSFDKVLPFCSVRVGMGREYQSKADRSHWEQERIFRYYRERDIEIEYVFQPDGSRDFTKGDLEPKTAILKAADFSHGFRFATGDMSTNGDHQRDIDYRDRYGTIGFHQVYHGKRGFYDAGEVPFESVTEADANPDVYPRDLQPLPVKLNHVYVVKTLGGKYAKFVVRKIGVDLERSDEPVTTLSFTLPDGTPTKDVIVNIGSYVPDGPPGSQQIARLQPAADGTFQSRLSPVANLIRARTRDGKFGAIRLVLGEERLQPIAFALEPAVTYTFTFVEKSTGKPIIDRPIVCLPQKAIPGSTPRRYVTISSTFTQTDENGVATLTVYVGADYAVNEFSAPGTGPKPRLPDLLLSPKTAGEVIDRGIIEVE